MRMHIAALCAALALGLAACVTDNTAERPTAVAAPAATSGIAQISAPTGSVTVAEIRQLLAGTWQGSGEYTPSYGGARPLSFDTSMNVDAGGTADLTSYVAEVNRTLRWPSTVVIVPSQFVVVLRYSHDWRRFGLTVENGVPVLRAEYPISEGTERVVLRKVGGPMQVSQR